MKSCETVATITALACAIHSCCTKEEVTLQITILSQLSSTLATLLAQDGVITVSDEDKTNIPYTNIF